jgi:excinuclease ABC subunit B
LIQTAGRAARNLNGKVIFYANRITDSMRKAMDETSRRRAKQTEFNELHGITPVGVTKRIKDIIDGVYDQESGKRELKAAQTTASYERMTEKQQAKELKALEKSMLEAARNLEFEKAAELRDKLKKLRAIFYGAEVTDL